MFEGLPETYEQCRDWTWAEFEPLAQALVAVDLNADNVESWLDGWTQVTRLYYEIGSRAFVATTVDTMDEAAVERYRIFNDHMQPEYSRVQNQLDRKLVESGLQPTGMEIALRKMRGGIELFREDNLPLLSAEQNLSTEYNRVIAGQTVEWDGEQMTLRQLQPILSEPDRDRRERAWRLTCRRSLEDRDQLNDIWTRSLDLRSQIAANADMPDYRAYRWKALNRFDYTPADALSFVGAIEDVATPAFARSMERRRRALGVDRLRPWDTQNDPQGRPPLRPFSDVADLRDKAIAIFRALDAELAGYLTLMRDEGCLDLDNRPNKAAGGFCFYFPLSRRPFLFMNAVGLHADVQIMVHEAGHAFHSFSTDHWPWAQQRDVPMEFAEVASMAMELLAAPYLSAEQGGFYSPADTARARIEHLEDSLRFWCFVAIVVGFQHWVYTHQDQARDPEKCDDQWERLWDRCMPGIDYSGFEDYKRFRWRERMHIFNLPFYFIEYGLAQLGAVQVWANSLNDQKTALKQYREALRLGATVSLPQLFQAAGAKFAFDADTLRDAVNLIETTVAELEAVERAASS